MEIRDNVFLITGGASGLGAATARLLAAQTALGAAKMVLETGEHPAVLFHELSDLSEDAPGRLVRHA